MSHPSHARSASEGQPLLALEESPATIGMFTNLEPKKSPCPALNALCNHGAYGIPRDGRGVKAQVLVKALIDVYGLTRTFAYVLVYGAFLGITHGRSLTLDMDQLCAAPIAHFAPLAHLNPSDKDGSTEGRPSLSLVKEMLKTDADVTDGTDDFTLEDFARWRNIREQEVRSSKLGKMPKPAQYIAAGELSLLLQVFGDPKRKWAVPRSVLSNFLANEQLPPEWLPKREPPKTRVGIWSTVNVSSQIRRAMKTDHGQLHVPWYVLLVVLLAGVGGLFLLKKKLF